MSSRAMARSCQSCSTRSRSYASSPRCRPPREALATAERERIDAALVDHTLGDHDGLWESRELKRLPRPPRVVLCCQSSHGLLAAAAVIAEADALVSTPANGPELCQTIRSTLDGRQVLPTIPPAVGSHDARAI